MAAASIACHFPQFRLIINAGNADEAIPCEADADKWDNIGKESFQKSILPGTAGISPIAAKNIGKERPTILQVAGK